MEEATKLGDAKDLDTKRLSTPPQVPHLGPSQIAKKGDEQLERPKQRIQYISSSSALTPLLFGLLLLILIFADPFTLLFPSLFVSASSSEYSVGGVEAYTTTPPSPFQEVNAYAVSSPTFSGFLEPINPDGSSVFKLGSTIPIKFQLKGPDGQQPPLPVPNSNVRIFTAKVSDKVTGTDVETVSNTTSSAEGTIASRGRGASAADRNEPTPGNHFIYDPSTNQYVFNIGTNDLSPGTWQIKVVLDDGNSQTVNISLIE